MSLDQRKVQEIHWNVSIILLIWLSLVPFQLHLQQEGEEQLPSSADEIYDSQKRKIVLRSKARDMPMLLQFDLHVANIHPPTAHKSVRSQTKLQRASKENIYSMDYRSSSVIRRS